MSRRLEHSAGRRAITPGRWRADDLFKSVMAPLPKRDPPGRIYWPKPWATGVLVSLMLATAVGLVSLRLSWLAQVALAALLSFAICIFWRVCRPIFEAERSIPSSQEK